LISFKVVVEQFEFPLLVFVNLFC